MGVLLSAVFTIGTVGCQSDTDERGERAVDGATVGSTASELFVLSTVLWKTPSAIPVCWEVAGFATEKAWVASAMKTSWETASTAIKFTGWEACTAASKGIRITVNSNDPDGPHVVAFGAELDGVKNGMVLDFAFSTNAFPNCKTGAMRERCIRAIATHEFGHAIGFLHEQERADTPASCPDRVPGGLEDTTTKKVGAWDLMSIMNYCYPDRDNVFPTALSPTDIQGTREMYPPPAPVTPPTTTPPATDTPAEPKSKDTTGTGGKADTADSADEADEDEDVVKPKAKKRTGGLAPAASSGCSAAPLIQGSAGSSWLLVVAACAAVARLRRRRA